jgi:hypothetical protein
VDLQVDRVLLMLVFADQQRIVQVRNAELAAEGDAGNFGALR